VRTRIQPIEIKALSWITSPRIVKSWRKNKKLAVLSPKGWIHFGDTRYQDYTQHKDPARRAAYLARATRIKNKKGALTWRDPYSPNFWSVRILWKG
jgi:hypothetical protein